MVKYIKTIVIFLVALLLVYLVANYIVNYSNLLGDDNHDDDIVYFNNYSIYYSKDTGIFFDYPSTWTYSTYTEGTKNIERITKDNNNYLEIMGHPVEEDFNGTIEDYIEEDYKKVLESYKIANYTIDENEVREMFGFNVAVLSLTDGKHFYDNYSWINEYNYFNQIIVCYDVVNINDFTTLLKSVHLSNGENEKFFESSQSSLSFYYPDFLIYLGETIEGEEGNIVNENFAYNEETSITVSTVKLDNIGEKDYLNKAITPYQDSETERLRKNGYTLKSSGLTTAFNKQFYFYLFDNGDHHYNNFYWYEENNGEALGCEITFRYNQEYKNEYLEIIRSFSFEE